MRTGLRVVRWLPLWQPCVRFASVVDVEANVARAVTALADKDFPAALGLLSEAAASAPADARVYTARAACFEEAGQLEEAERDHRRVVQLLPASPPAYLALAECLRRANKLDEALRTLELLLGIVGDYGAALVCQGRCLAQAGDHAAAARSFTRALECDGDDSFALAGLADWHVRCGRFPDAERALRRVVEAQPLWWQQWALLGAVCYETGRFADAAQCYTSAIQVSGDAQCHVRRASALVHLGQAREALLDLDAAGSAGAPLALLVRGWAQLQLEQWSAAADALSQWLAVGDAQQLLHAVRVQCAYALLKSGRAEEGRALLALVDDKSTGGMDEALRECRRMAAHRD